MLLSRFLVAALCLLTACGGSSVLAKTPDGERPDVVLVVVDTLRADRLQPYGCERPTSPFIAQLAQQGAVFEDVTAQGPWTKPSMVSMLQSRYLTGYRDTTLPGSPTMAEVFGAAGYRTAAVVGNLLLSPEGGFHRGFDLYDHHQAGDRAAGQSPSRSGQEISDAAQPLLDQVFATDANGQRPPVFLWLHFMEPHWPYETHPEYAAELPVHAVVLSDRREYFERVTGETVDVRQWVNMARKLAAYDQEVRAADHWIEQLLTDVGALGDLNNTVVAVVADHGEGLWERFAPEDVRRSDTSRPEHLMFGGHGRVIDRNLVSTPMILRGPGVPPQVRVALPAANVDLFPTLLELCGIPAPPALDGRSLVGALHGERLSEHPMYSRVLKERSVRDLDSSYRLVVPTELGRDSQREVRLFDLASDPLERHDLAGDLPDVVERLEQLLEEVEQRYPIDTNQGRKRSAQELSNMAALGYTGADG
jgi:arylsulfatase A-like enzyme